MKNSLLAASFGMLLLGSETAYAQSMGGVAPPQPSALHPDSNNVARTNREQLEGYNHVANTLERNNPSQPGRDQVKKVTAADIIVGATIGDIAGKPVGKVDSLAADGVVVDSGNAKVKVPLEAFGKDKSGLRLAITAAKFGELVAQAHAQNAAATAAAAKQEPRPATQADIATGAPLLDVDGKPVGKVTAVAADGATIDTGKTMVKLPIDAFGVDPHAGLVIGITAEKLDELIAQSRAPKTQQQ